MDAGFLTSTRLFAGLDRSDVVALAPGFAEHRFPDGYTVAAQGDEAGGVWVVREGRVRVTWRDPEDGLEYVGADLLPGDDAGLTECLAGSAYQATLITAEASTLLALDRETLRSFLGSRPAASRAVLLEVATRWNAERSRRASPVVDLTRLKADPDLWTVLPRNAILKYRALPLARHGGVLVVGFVDPGDLEAVDNVRRLIPGMRVRPVAMDAAGFSAFYRHHVLPEMDRRQGAPPGPDRWFQVLQRKPVDLHVLEAALPATVLEERARHVTGDQVVALMNRLLGEALELEASDIHVEPGERELVVRYRVDGRLKKRPEPLDLRYALPLVSRLKVLANMDIAEKRKPQDGRLAILHESRRIDFRLSTVPTRYGETLVLRILDPTTLLIDLERLVTWEPAYQALRWMIAQPQGMVLVAGPTGSGKTTTIYSAMLRLKEEEVNIVSIEDPIEYSIDGVTQVQVNDAAGVGFANSVRHFLRQDPDVIIVGETRDPLTAATAIEAALTGHLVFTSLHANDALGTVLRLREMGVDPFLVAHTVIGVVSQRLVRRVCPQCREPVEYAPELIRPLRLYEPGQGEEGDGAGGSARERFTFFRGRGCIHCNYLGFRGRVGVFETLRLDDRLKPAVASGEPLPVLERTAREAGLLHPLRAYCRHLLERGITTPEEVTRILFTEG